MKVCKNPCTECPFTKKSLRGWLADYESPENLHRLIMSEIPFPCHMTQENDLSILEAMRDNEIRCKGALLYMKKACKMPRNKEVFEMIKSFTINDTEDILSVPEFIKHHSISYEK